MEVNKSLRQLAWIAGGGIPLAIVLAPVAAIVFSAFASSSAYLDDRGWTLAGYWVSTLISTAIAGAFAYLLGVVGAWILAMYRFPFKRVVSILLVLPLAVPPYLSAYTTSGFFALGGPLSTFLEAVGWVKNFHFAPEGPVALGFLLGLQLYPYVLLMVRPALESGLRSSLDAARSLGKKGPALFVSPGLALVRPFAMAGMIFVLMESLSEYGSAVYWGASTVTQAMMRAWSHQYDLSATLWLALGLCALAVVFVAVERFFRRSMKFREGLKSHRANPPLGSSRLSSFVCLAIAFATMTPGLLIPIGQMLWWLSIYPQPLASTIFDAAFQSVALTLASATTIVVFSLAVVLVVRGLKPGRHRFRAHDFVRDLGYAVPSIVLALGVLILTSGTNLAQGGLVVLGYALLVRFYAVAHSGLSNTWTHRVEAFHDAACLYHKSFWQRCTTTYLPMLRPALLSSGLLVALDLFKELNSTLVLRPIGVQTLPTLIYEQASQELPHMTAGPGLALLACTGTIALLIEFLRKEKSNATP